MGEFIHNVYNFKNCPFLEISEFLPIEKKNLKKNKCIILIFDNFCSKKFYKEFFEEAFLFVIQFIYDFIKNYNIDKIYFLKSSDNSVLKIDENNLFNYFKNFNVYPTNIAYKFNDYLNVQDIVDNYKNSPDIVFETLLISFRKKVFSNDRLNFFKNLNISKNISFNCLSITDYQNEINCEYLKKSNIWIYLDTDDRIGKNVENVLYNGLVFTNLVKKKKIKIIINENEKRIKLPYYILKDSYDCNNGNINIKDESLDSYLEVTAINNLLRDMKDIDINSLSKVYKKYSVILKNIKKKNNNTILSNCIYKCFISFIKISLLNIIVSENKENNKFKHFLEDTFVVEHDINILEDLINNVHKLLSRNLDTNYLKKIDDIDKQKLKRSSDFFSSMITCSNWIEELEDNSSMGLLLKVSNNHSSMLGWTADVDIVNVTNSFIPISTYYDVLDNFIKNKNNKSTNINYHDIIHGTAIGNGNCIIPLYINKDHWKLAKNDMDLVLGIIMAHNPFMYNKYHVKFVFRLMTHFNYELISSNLNLKLISCFWATFRTVAEISFDKKYNRGIKKIVKNYFKDPLKRISNNEFDYTIMLGQIISTGYELNIEDSNKLVEYILQEIIRKLVFRFKNRFGKIDIKNYYFELKELIIQNLSIHLKYLFSFLVLNESISIFKKKMGNYNAIIKELDNNFGLMPEKQNIEFRNILKSILLDRIVSNLDVENFYKFRNTKLRKNNYREYLYIDIIDSHLKNGIHNLKNKNFIKKNKVKILK